MTNSSDEERMIHLTKLGMIPLYVVLPSLVWVLHDYCEYSSMIPKQQKEAPDPEIVVTLEDEIKYMWRQKPSFSKFMFFWIRYYTIFLVAFDVVQIHGFAIPGVITRDLCVAADPVTRMAGAISLWSIEIFMMMRIYVLFNRSKKVAVINAILFIISIGLFLWIMIVNALQRKAMIDGLSRLPPRGCPSINGGTQWALWMPAMLFEFVLFGFAIYKAAVSTSVLVQINERASLVSVLLSENIVYFAIIGSLLLFNNIMVVGKSGIPWFGFGPFHAAMGIVTSRMIIHLRRFSAKNLEGQMSAPPSAAIQFVGAPVSYKGKQRAVLVDHEDLNDSDDEESETSSIRGTVNDIENHTGGPSCQSQGLHQVGT